MILPSELLLKTFSFIFLIILFVWIERVKFLHSQKIFRIGFQTDVINIIVNGLGVDLIIKLIALSILWFYPDISHFFGLSLFEGYSLTVQFFILVFVSDFIGYFLHWSMHRFHFLWKLHEAHHSIEYMDWAGAFRNHVFGQLYLNTFGAGSLFLLGFSPEVYFYKFFLDLFWTMFVHSNVRFRFGWLNYIFITPQMHHWHHTPDQQRKYMNLGVKFSFFDWAFRTAYLDDLPPKKFGLGYFFPVDYIGQQAYLFKPKCP
jgi:sterol desaturase/sphingolipid hydroxylase (fatty acid hydroxylase superfamily)